MSSAASKGGAGADIDLLVKTGNGTPCAGPGPSSIIREHGTFKCRRGYDLYTTHLRPNPTLSQACIVFHHGLSDHSARHLQVLEYMVSQFGIHVYTFDAHSHGRSGPDDGLRVRITSYTHLLDDLLDYVQQVALAESPGRDVYLWGYSMGGLVCNLAVQRSPPGTFKGLMLTSALCDIFANCSPVVKVIKEAIVALLCTLMPTATLFPRNPVEAGIRDPAAVQEMKEDQLWSRGKFRPCTVHSLVRGCRALEAGARKVTLPVYAQHGTRDVACSLDALKLYLARTRSCDVRLVVLEGAFHDLHHDPELPYCLEQMAAWLRPRIAAAGAAQQQQQ